MRLGFKTALWTLAGAVVGLVLAPENAEAATLSLSPNSGSFSVGQTITVAVKVNSAGVAINAAEATVAFSTDTLQFSGLSKSGSIFKFWAVEPNASGSKITFSGGLPNPGFTGSSGTILTMTFLAKAEGTATVKLSGSKVLANDGFGTNVLTSQGSATFTIGKKAAPAKPAPASPYPAPAVSSTTHPDEDNWYTADSAALSWTQPAGMRGVNYALTDSPTSEPGTVLVTNKRSVELPLPSEGVWYFHLRAQYSTGASSIVHFRLQYDATPPQPFTLELVRDRGVSDPSPEVKFEAADAVSGVRRYAMSVDDGEDVDVRSPATIPVTSAGKHRVKITAYDRAGNAAEASLEFEMEGYPAPVITFVSSPLLLLDSLVVKGTANIGDTVVVYVSDEEIGRVIAGVVSEETVTGTRAPWALTTDRLFRPGSYRVTAVALGPNGEQSVPSDFSVLTVSGHQVVINGRIIATVAILPAAGFAVVMLTSLVIAALFFLASSANALRRRELQADADLEALRERVHKGKISLPQVDSTLLKIDQELHGQRRRKKKTKADGV